MPNDSTMTATHPALEVPGGLWRCAPCLESGENDAVVTLVDWGAHAYRVTLADGSFCGACDGDLALCLDDRLGLGLAGLGVRVGVRHDGSNNTDPMVIAEVLLEDRPEWLELINPGHDRPVMDWVRLVICAAASYLALTDRLCAAVGLTLEDGEVARWSSFTHDGETRWTLTTASSEVAYMPRKSLVGLAVPALADIAPDDWLGGLRACCEVTRPPTCPPPAP